MSDRNHPPGYRGRQWYPTALEPAQSPITTPTVLVPIVDLTQISDTEWNRLAFAQWAATFLNPADDEDET